MSAAYAATVELFKAEAEWRRLFGRVCRDTPARLRGIAPQVRAELAERGQRYSTEEVEDVLLTFAREKLPDSPAAQWDADHADELCKGAMDRLQAHYGTLDEAARERLDLSDQESFEAQMEAAGEDNDSAAFRRALTAWERVGVAAIGEVRAGKGAA
jgi:hypothetical protein